MSALAEAVTRAFEAGKAEAFGATKQLILLQLESGARLGLDAEARFTLTAEGGEPKVLDATTARDFHELVEQSRDAFDTALEARAKELGLTPNDLVCAFPAPLIVRAILDRDFPYLSRLALLWVIPSERRELADVIARAARSERLPPSIREIAERLLVA
jgi:hypothetical protein